MTKELWVFCCIEISPSGVQMDISPRNCHGSVRPVLGVFVWTLTHLYMSRTQRLILQFYTILYISHFIDCVFPLKDFFICHFVKCCCYFLSFMILCRKGGMDQKRRGCKGGERWMNNNCVLIKWLVFRRSEAFGVYHYTSSLLFSPSALSKLLTCVKGVKSLPGWTAFDPIFSVGGGIEGRAFHRAKRWLLSHETDKDRW